jgi:uncharacterized protein YidB (DUF937 family)
MGMLGNLLGGLMGGGQQGGGMAGAVIQMLLSQAGQSGPGGQAGGLAALMQAMNSNGLGDVMKSWISTGQNMPISGAQLSQVLGQGQIAELAQQAGVAAHQAPEMLAGLLPNIVDRLTPHGAVPAENDLASMGMGLLKQFMGGK